VPFHCYSTFPSSASSMFCFSAGLIVLVINLPTAPCTACRCVDWDTKFT